MPVLSQPCGTRTAYDRHREHGERPCRPCQVANAVEKGRQRRLRDTATRVLGARHPAEYRAIKVQVRRELLSAGRFTSYRARDTAAVRLRAQYHIEYEKIWEAL